MLALVAALWPVGPVRAEEKGSKSGVTPQVINLPTGPGSIQGLGDAFQPQLNTGVAGYRVPIALPQGTGGHGPSLTLAYSGGSGNGPFGMGWRMDVPFIQRQTDKGLPRYDASDRFIFSTGEELVPVGDGFYRARIEGGFMRFRRMPAGPGTDEHWEVTEKSGKRWLLGSTGQSRQSSGRGVFCWLAESYTDTNDNEIRFFYRQDDGQIYLNDIRYNFPRGTAFGSEPFERSVRVTVEYDTSRADTIDDYRSRARVRTNWRARALEITSLGQRVRRYELTYDEADGNSQLAAVRQLGQDLARWEDDPTRGIPPVTFSYTRFDPARAANVGLTEFPGTVWIGAPNVDLVDINADGLPDVVNTESADYDYYLNRGRNRISSVPAASTLGGDPQDVLSSPDVRLADIDGDSRVDLLVKQGSTGRARFYYHPNRGRMGWEPQPVSLGVAPDFPIESPNVQLVDLDNDKRIDALYTDASGNYIYLNRPGDWNQIAVRTPALGDGGPLLFSSPRVKLADMNGDHLLDIVVLEDRDILYFASTGLGEFESTPVRMEGSPAFVDLEGPIELTDVDGNGLTDLLNVQSHTVVLYRNFAGRRYAPSVMIRGTPDYDARWTHVRTADMNGDGATDLLFTHSPGAVAYADTVRFVDFTGGTLPNLLTTVDNGLGRVIRLNYRTSTDYYVDAWQAGAPWTLWSPVPVTVVSRSTVHDKLSGQDYVTDYIFRNGYYDAEDKAFRGFALAEQIDRGDATAPTGVQRTIFDTGATDESRKGQVLQVDALAEGGSCGDDSTMAEVSAATHLVTDSDVPKVGGRAGETTQAVTGCFQRTINRLASRRLAAGITGDGRPVSHTVVVQSDTLVYENTPSYRRKQQVFAYDDFGNQTEQFDYGEVAADGTNPGLGNDERLTFSTFVLETERWILDRVAETRQTDLAGTFGSHARSYYDGPPYLGLPIGHLTRGNLSRQEGDTGPNDPDRRWVQSQRAAYDAFGNKIGRMDPNGTVDDDSPPGSGGHWTEVDYESVYHQYPSREVIHLENGQTLSLGATHDLVRGVITAAREFNGHDLGFTYDPLSRLIAIVKPGDSAQLPTQGYTYTLGSEVSSVTTDSREVSGAASVYRSIAFVDGLGRTVQTRSEGEDAKVIVSGGVTFNARGKEQGRFLPHFASDAMFDYSPIEPSSPHGMVEYDQQLREVRVTNPDGSFRDTYFQPLKQIIADEEDTNTASVHFKSPLSQEMDGLDRVTASIARNGTAEFVTKYEYDLLNSITTIIDAVGNEKMQGFDGLGRKLRMIDPDRGWMIFRYDNAGNVVETTDAKGQRVLSTYDGANRPLSENWILSIGDTTPDIRYHHDTESAPEYPDSQNSLGRVTWIEDASGREYLSYDPRGNVMARIKRIESAVPVPDLVTKLRYDSMDRPTALTYPDGTTIDYRYNTQNQLDEIPGFINDIDYTASAQRSMLSAADGVTTTYGYDDRLRLRVLRSENSSGEVLQALHYSLDGADNVLAIDDRRPGRTTVDDDSGTYTVDGLYRLTGVQYSRVDHEMIDYAYDPIGNMVRQTAGIQDADLGDMAYGQGAGPHALTEIAGQKWSYDPNGNLTQRPGILTSDPDLALQWDFRDRLTHVRASDGLHQDNTFDHANRRISKLVTSTSGQSFVLYPDPRVEVRDSLLVEYVFAGSTRIAEVQKPFSHYRLIRGFSGETLRFFGFDVNDDQLVSLNEVAARGGHAEIVEIDEANDALALFLSRDESEPIPISLATAAQVVRGSSVPGRTAPAMAMSRRYYHSDHLGSTTLITDQNGEPRRRTSYYPYGAERSRTTTDGLADHGFAGKELDRDVGLYDFGARFYDPQTSRFISVDPLLEMHATTDSALNPAYGYAGLNPVRLIDPDGRAPLPAWLNTIKNDQATPWLTEAYKEFGQAEDKAKITATFTYGSRWGGWASWTEPVDDPSRSNARILQYHAASPKLDASLAQDDQTPWCASFVNFTLERAGIKGTGSAEAKSFLTFGKTAYSQPFRGAIAVLQDKKGYYHVGYVSRVDVKARTITLMGGNQGQMAKESSFSADSVVAYVAPIDFEPTSADFIKMPPPNAPGTTPKTGGNAESTR